MTNKPQYGVARVRKSAAPRADIRPAGLSADTEAAAFGARIRMTATIAGRSGSGDEQELEHVESFVGPGKGRDQPLWPATASRGRSSGSGPARSTFGGAIGRT